MKINKLIIFTLVIIGNFVSCKASQMTELFLLDVKESQVKEAFKLFVEEERKYGDVTNSIFIVKIEKSEKNYELRIGALDKESMSSYLVEKHDKPFGYLNYEGVTIIVFGEDKNPFFEKSSIKSNFSFFKSNKKLKIKKGEIPPPPVIYEPVIWIYIYEKGKLELMHKGRFTLLI